MDEQLWNNSVTIEVQMTKSEMSGFGYGDKFTDYIPEDKTANGNLANIFQIGCAASARDN